MTKKTKPMRARRTKAGSTDSPTASTAIQSLVGLMLGPIDVDAHNWLYVERDGLCVVHQVTNKANAVIKTDQFYLPWLAVRRAVAIRYKKKQPKK